MTKMAAGDVEGQDKGNPVEPSTADTLGTVGKRIAHARQEKKMSQAKLAMYQGISRSAVAQWERNAASPPIATIEQIAMILDVSAEWLAFGADSSRRATRDCLTWRTLRSSERSNSETVPMRQRLLACGVLHGSGFCGSRLPGWKTSVSSRCAAMVPDSDGVKRRWLTPAAHAQLPLVLFCTGMAWGPCSRACTPYLGQMSLRCTLI